MNTAINAGKKITLISLRGSFDKKLTKPAIEDKKKIKPENRYISEEKILGTSFAEIILFNFDFPYKMHKSVITSDKPRQIHIREPLTYKIHIE